MRSVLAGGQLPFSLQAIFSSVGDAAPSLAPSSLLFAFLRPTPFSFFWVLSMN